MDYDDDDAKVAMIGLVRADGAGAVLNPSAPQHMRQEMTR
jgi:hypothetical protein